MSDDPALKMTADWIASYEGFRPVPYQDAGGVWTVGYGFTVTADGRHVRFDTPPVDQAAAYARLTAMVGRVLTLVRGMAAIPLTDHQAAALASLAYNVGTNAVRNSTLLRLINHGSIALAADQFGAWVYCDGCVSPGLVQRRKSERTLFLTPDLPAPAGSPVPQE